MFGRLGQTKPSNFLRQRPVSENSNSIIQTPETIIFEFPDKAHCINMPSEGSSGMIISPWEFQRFQNRVKLSDTEFLWDVRLYVDNAHWIIFYCKNAIAAHSSQGYIIS